MHHFASFLRLYVIVVLVSGMLIQTQTVYAASLPAEINKQFTPLQISAGGISVMRVTVFNPNVYPLTNASWVDNLIGVQPGLFIANPAGIVNTCGGTATAAPGATNLSLSGGTVPPQVGATPGSCYVEINISSVTAGNLINTIPANNLTSQGNDGGTIVNITNTTPASATITIGTVTPPSITKGFTPNTIFLGEVSRLTITLNNNDNSANLTGTSYTDTLPAGVVLANPVNATATNCGAYTLTANPGGSDIAVSNATVTPNLNCVILVNVTGSSGTYTNTIPAGPGNPGSVHTDQGVTNNTPASATLNIQPVGVTKSFAPANFQAGDTTTLTITLQNPTGSAYTGVSIADTLPGVFIIATLANATNTCGGAVTAAAGTKLVNLAGGTIPASGTPPTPPGTCTITVQVTAPAGSPASTSTNTIPANTLTANQPGVTNIISSTANVTTYATGTGITSSKSFTPNTITPGQNTRLRINLTAPADTNLTNFSITDNLPPGVTITNSTPATKTTGCIGGTLNAPTGGTAISWTGGIINAGTLCRIDVFVTSNTPGPVTNTITPANISNNENRAPANNITANLTVSTPSDLTVSKAFFPNQVIPGGISTLTIRLQNTNVLPLVNATATDDLTTMGTGGNAVVIAPTPNASTTCGGTLTAVVGTQIISLTGGTVPAQSGGVPGICTITVDVRAQSNTTTRTNTIPLTNVTGQVQGTGTTINALANATATLQTLPLSIGVVKGFNPVLVYGGASSTLSIQLINPNNVTLTGVAFTDDMTLLGTGMEIANPSNLNVGTCGGALSGNPGDTAFSFSGGSLPANTTCTVTLLVTMTVNGNLTNRLPAGAVTTLNGVSSQFATEASLTNLPGVSVSKAFSPNPIAAGSYSALTITVKNTGNIPLTGLGLDDTMPGTLPTGLIIVSAPAPAPVNNCGGTLTATPGTQLIQLVNGALGAASTCTIVVSISGAVPGNYQNTIPAGALLSAEGATNSTPATDSLSVLAGINGLTKTITGSDLPSTTGSNVAIGEIATYQVSVTIPPGTHINSTLVDTLQRGLAFVGCDSINATGLTTSIAGGFTSICSTPTTSDAGGGTPADVDRKVTYDFGTLTNSGQTDATLTVTYRAIVLDIATNSDGTHLNNSVVWNSDNIALGPVQAQTTVVEPDLIVQKTADVNFIANGSEVTFTLSLSHTQSSHSDAYDVVVNDVLPTGLDFVPNSLDCTAGQQDPTTCTYDPNTRTISATWSTFTLLPAGDHGIIQFRVIGNTSIPSNGKVTNTASAAWTSMPGDHSTPQSFSNPANAFATERSHDPLNGVNIYSSSSSLTLTPLGSNGGGNGSGGNKNKSTTASSSLNGFLIPITGFTPNVQAILNKNTQPAYDSTGISIEIPTLKVETSIVGVNLQNGSWDVSWLQNQIGWLNGTAYPTWDGNSVLTGHVVNADGKPGIFNKLKYLKAGEYIFVYDSGYRYTYQVVSNKTVRPNDISVLQHEERAYLTLLTCDNYNIKSASYLNRIAVRAVLVDVQVIQ